MEIKLIQATIWKKRAMPSRIYKWKFAIFIFILNFLMLENYIRKYVNGKFIVT